MDSKQIHNIRTARNRRKRLIQNALVFTGATTAALLLAEILLRLFVPMEKSTVIYDPLLGLRGRPHVKTVWTREIENNPMTVRTNSHGFHDVERNESKSKGTHRIVFVGDSFTEAYQVPINKNFVRRLEREFKADRKLPGVEHINAGLHTWGLGSYYLYIKHRIMKWSPDTVVLCLYMGNDLHDNYYGTGSSALPRFATENGGLKHIPAPRYNFKIWARDNMAGRSSLVRLLWTSGLGRSKSVFNIARRQGLVGTPEIAAQKLGDNGLAEIALIAELQIRETNAFLRAQGVRLVAFVIPDPRRVNAMAGKTDNIGIPITQKHAVFYEREIIHTLRREQIPYAYPLEDFTVLVRSGREIYLNGGGHFSAFGHQQAATEIREPLRKAIIEK